MARTGRPKKEYNRQLFEDLVGIGCTQEEICFVFRDESGKSANIDTLSRWCRRTYGMTFQEYSQKNKALTLKIKLRQNQLKLSEKSAAMAIWLGKQYLNQKEQGDPTPAAEDDGFMDALTEKAKEVWHDAETGTV